MDVQYDFPFQGIAQRQHQYGDKVHILSSPSLTSLLGLASSDHVSLPLLNDYVQILYTQLLMAVLDTCAPLKKRLIHTRMKPINPKGELQIEMLDPNQRYVIVDLARAGTWPSHVCFQTLHYLVDAKNLRQDHIYLNRKTNEKEEVIGVDFSGSKIGGDQENSIILFPDPMGATGVSLGHALGHYKKDVQGKAKLYIALHLIITPEYIKYMTTHFPELHIFALRLDRGLSSPEILQTILGTHWDEEKGLNEKQYIVPGAGGVGEILNNSFI